MYRSAYLACIFCFLTLWIASGCSSHAAVDKKIDSKWTLLDSWQME